jgi:hypothetical protein
MHRIGAFSLLIVLAATAVFAHGGHVHSFLGTVKSVADTRLVITTRDAKEVAFVLTNATTYTRDGKAATKSDLKSGLRVAVHVADDGKTATAVNLGRE